MGDNLGPNGLSGVCALEMAEAFGGHFDAAERFAFTN